MIFVLVLFRFVKIINIAITEQRPPLAQITVELHEMALIIKIRNDRAKQHEQAKRVCIKTNHLEGWKEELWVGWGLHLVL